MSLLMFRHDPNSALVVTDTLATDRGIPTLFKTKTFIVPHLQMVVALTGVANVGEAWVAQLYGGLLARDIDMAAQHTQAELRRIEDELLGGPTEPPNTSTIYYFGFSPSADQCVRYAFRSTRNFAPERDDVGGFGIKPPPTTLPSQAPNTLDEIIGLAEQVRSEQDQIPPEERISIGGELYLTSVDRSGFTCRRIHQFADVEDHWHAMHDHHNAWS